MLADSLEYGVAVFQRAATDGTTADVELTLADSATVPASTFAEMVRRQVAALATPDDFAVLYVHGFGTSLHEAWKYTAQARQLTGQRAPWIAFCWPSNGHGIDWPRRGELLTRAYRADSIAANASRPAFARATSMLVEALDRHQLVMAVHSLGAQVAGEAVAGDTAFRATLQHRPLRALAFMVPDVETTHFRNDLLPALTDIAHRRVLYVSGRDRALALAATASGTPRAGRRTNPLLSAPALETVDITDGVTTEGWFQRVFGTHHAIRRQAGMLFDLGNIVGSGRAASCRTVLGTGRMHDDSTWALRPVALPPRDMVRGCPPFHVDQ
jgi:esterase/lipase superfamily enzyme